MTKVLITGATGFVGTNLCRKFAEKYDIIGVARSFSQQRASDKVHYAFGDLASPNFVSSLINKYQPDVVLHLAAQTIVKAARRAVSATFRDNVIATLNLLEACANAVKKPRFILMSTDKVVPYLDARENDPYPPRMDVYGRTKMIQELLVRDYSDRLSALTFRCCNVYGPFDESPRIIPNTIRAVMSGRRPIIYKEKERSFRQYIFVDDLLAAIEKFIDEEVSGLYHVGSPDIKTNEAVVKEVLKHFPGIEPLYITPPKERGILRQSLNWERIKKELGWKPKVSFEEGIVKTVGWWRFER